jgi:GNAT superfamily N-acetyltransferase
VSELSPAAIDALTHVDGEAQVVLVATGDSPDLKSERGLGLARYVRLADDPEVAEPAITVIDPMQSKGIGRLLAIALGEAAYERGIRRFRGEVLASNAPMRAFLAEAGATIVRDFDDAIVFDVPLDAHAPATSLTRWIAAAARHLVGSLVQHG